MSCTGSSPIPSVARPCDSFFIQAWPALPRPSPASALRCSRPPSGPSPLTTVAQASSSPLSACTTRSPSRSMEQVQHEGRNNPGAMWGSMPGCPLGAEGDYPQNNIVCMHTTCMAGPGHQGAWRALPSKESSPPVPPAASDQLPLECWCCRHSSMLADVWLHLCVSAAGLDSATHKQLLQLLIGKAGGSASPPPSPPPSRSRSRSPPPPGGERDQCGAVQPDAGAADEWQGGYR